MEVSPEAFMQQEPELMWNMLLYLDVQSLAHLCTASSKLRELCESQWLWKLKFQKDFPEAYEETPFVETDPWRNAYIQQLIDTLRQVFGEYHRRVTLKQNGLLEEVYPPFSPETRARIQDTLDLGIDPNVPLGPEGETALIWVAEAGDVEVVRQLLDAGADPNLSDTRRRTPLTIALHNENVPVIRELLEAGAQPPRVLSIAHRRLLEQIQTM